jgi:hypothetical protein
MADDGGLGTYQRPGVADVLRQTDFYIPPPILQNRPLVVIRRI